jgi:hypothetical protein
MEMMYFVFCKEGEVHLINNLFREEVLYDVSSCLFPIWLITKTRV